MILPLTRNNLGAVDIALKNNFNWTAVGEGLETKFVNLTMPRFKLEHEIDLKTTLQFMKITDLFSEALCDLSGMYMAFNIKCLCLSNMFLLILSASAYF